MNLTKNQKERYAVEIYRHFFCSDGFEVIKFESPDFIIWKRNGIKIGIETTTPSNKKQNELVKIANSKNRDELGNRFNYLDYKNAGQIHEYGVALENSTPHKINDIVLQGIHKKLVKLNRNYTLFDKNILCCTPICSFLNNESDRMDFVHNLNKINTDFNILYDEISIITYDAILTFSLNTECNYIFADSQEIFRELSFKTQQEVIALY